MSRVLSDLNVAADFLTEVSMPAVAFSQGQVYLTADKVAPQLPSGVSFTTVCGLFYGDYICRLIAKHAGMSYNQRGRTWDYLNWGDDIVMKLPAGTDVPSLLKRVTADLQLELDEEPTLRYLGFNYASGKVKANKGYSLGRMILKHMFPETPKFYPFSVIGYVARLEFMHDPEQFHRLALEHWWPDSMGPKFPFKDRKAILEKALLDSLQEDKFDSDALNFLLHGLNAEEASQLLDPLGVDFDFSDWIGHHYTDYSDPIKTLRAMDEEMYASSKTMLSRLQLGGSQALPNFANWIIGKWGLRHDGIVF
jgi:hypothetical protein